MKQYTIIPAYTDNYHVIQCEDGKVVSDNIVVSWQLDGYLAAVRALGYVEAHYAPRYAFELAKAKEAYEWAKEQYEKAQANPLHINEEDAKKLLCFEDFVN